MNPQEQVIVDQAMQILDRHIKIHPFAASSPDAVRRYLRIKLEQQERELFGVLFLDAQNRVIAFEEMFLGSLTECRVYPREIARAALGHNAAAVILAHNHPSGVSTPSQADIALTKALVDALSSLDIRILDHMVIGAGEISSLAEKGLMP